MTLTIFGRCQTVRAAFADTWVVFLCTDVKLGEAKIPEVYSLRWSIEV